MFILLNTDGQMHRGCMSDKSKSKLLCQKNDKDCFKCNSTDCNYLQNFQLKNPVDEMLMDGPMFDQLFDTVSEFDSSSSEKADAQSEQSDAENAYDDGESDGENGSETDSESGESEHKPNNKPVHKPPPSSARLNTFSVFTVAIAALFTLLMCC